MRMAVTAFAIFSTLLCGCEGYSGDKPLVDSGAAMPSGTQVALRQPVQTGDVVLTPMAVVEDSRCAIGTQCIWAGQVVVTTRIDGPGWRETIDLIAGKTATVRGHDIALVAVSPAKTGDDMAPEDYRFTYNAK